MEKKVYFVRHGQSLAEEKGIYDEETNGLSELGRQQSEFLAKRCSDLEIDTLISSSCARALETAQIIDHTKYAGIVISDLVSEWKKPIELIGRGRRDNEVLELLQNWRDNAANPKWRYSHGETFFELRERAGEAFKFIESRDENALLIVTHSGLLKMFLAHLISQGEVTPEEYFKVIDTFSIGNTGMTYCTYDPESSPHWKLVAWNDHAHLGEIN